MVVRVMLYMHNYSFTLFPTFCSKCWQHIRPTPPQINWCQEWAMGEIRVPSRINHHSLWSDVVFHMNTHTFFWVCLCLSFSLNHLESLHLLYEKKQTCAYSLARPHAWWASIRINPVIYLGYYSKLTPVRGGSQATLFTNNHSATGVTVSINFLFSMRGLLSLMSLEVSHVLIWSLNLYTDRYTPQN